MASIFLALRGLVGPSIDSEVSHLGAYGVVSCSNICRLLFAYLACRDSVLAREVFPLLQRRSSVLASILLGRGMAQRVRSNWEVLAFSRSLWMC